MNKKLLALIFGAGLVLAACGGGDDNADTDTSTDSGTTTETASVDAEKVVNGKCIMCHGQNLEGQGNAPALNDVGARLSQDEILDVIVNGQGSMPGNIISGEDAQAVAEWLAEKK